IGHGVDLEGFSIWIGDDQRVVGDDKLSRRALKIERKHFVDRLRDKSTAFRLLVSAQIRFAGAKSRLVTRGFFERLQGLLERKTSCFEIVAKNIAAIPNPGVGVREVRHQQERKDPAFKHRSPLRWESDGEGSDKARYSRRR